MWPCVIENIQKNKNEKGGAKVSFRFYEYSENVKIGNVFKSDSSNIELFFRESENHFEYKVLDLFFFKLFLYLIRYLKLIFKIE